MERTDWDRYYERPFAATSVTRRITQHRLLGYMRAHAPGAPGELVVAELGGANSCFFDAVQAALRPREYHVVDSNRLGLEKMQTRLGARPDVRYHCEDVLDLRVRQQADLVFSVGLVEHFPPEGTRLAVEAHFDLLRPGGTCIITFPTPTLLYRATRGAAELLRAWRFPDERPLVYSEVAGDVAPRGDVLASSIVWPIFLTQMVVVARKRGARAHGGSAEETGG